MAKPKPTTPPPEKTVQLKPGERFIFGNFVRLVRESGINPERARGILNDLILDKKVVECGGCGILGEVKYYEAAKD